MKLDRKFRMTLAALLAFPVVERGAVAHEFWIQPATLRPAANSMLRVELRHGERFAGDAVRRDPAHIERFTIRGPAGELPVVGRPGKTEQVARIGCAGDYVIGYLSKPIPHELPAGRFEAYLREEGLGEIAAERARRGEQQRVGREVYRRCAKTLLTVGDAGRETRIDDHLGMPLEFRLERISTDAAADVPSVAVPILTARLTFRGAPLKRAAVVAVAQAEPNRLIRLTTDDNGLVSVSLDRSGAWMITALHMVRSAAEQTADWESYWGSLTFDAPALGDIAPTDSNAQTSVAAVAPAPSCASR